MKNHCPFGLPVSAHNIEAKWTNDGHTGVALRFGQTGANIASHRTVAHKVTEKNMIKWTIVSHLGQAPHRRQTTDDGHDVWPAGARAKWIRWLVQSAATAIYPIKWRRSNSTTREEATQKTRKRDNPMVENKDVARFFHVPGLWVCVFSAFMFS